MEIALSAEPIAPAAPYGVTVRGVPDDEADLRQVFGIVDTSFAEHFGHVDGRQYEKWIEQWRKRAAFDLTLWRVAELDGDPVAVMLGMTVGDAGHVGTLGTLKAARGLGIGSHLLRAAFADFYLRGHRRVTLGVDAANETGAVRLYESVGMHPTQDWVLYELASIGPSPAGSMRSASKNV
jgi:ribosomal protein S18 acetylase RimI-like enzyme